MDSLSRLYKHRPIDGVGFNVWPTSRDGDTGPHCTMLAFTQLLRADA
jgi:hypothetical protein